MTADHEALLYKFRVASGLTMQEIKLWLYGHKCDYDEVLKFYLCAGRFPTDDELDFLNKTNFDSWHSLFRSNISLMHD